MPRPKDELGKFREALAGGDAARGKEILLGKVAVQCQRCHKLDGQGGEVGPPLNGVGKQTRDYLLESIVVPNKAIAKGYDSVLITDFGWQVRQRRAQGRGRQGSAADDRGRQDS